MSKPFQPPHLRPLPDGVRVHSSRELHAGRVFGLRHDSIELPSGLRQELDVIEHGGVACVAALDTEGRLLLVRQYRHAARDWLIEIPAGRLEREEQDPLQAARRELEEETGRRAARWSHLASFLAAPGFCSEVLHLYLAEELELAGADALAPDDDEEIELVWRSPAEVLATGDADAKTLIAASLLLLRAQGPSRDPRAG